MKFCEVKLLSGKANKKGCSDQGITFSENVELANPILGEYDQTISDEFTKVNISDFVLFKTY